MNKRPYTLHFHFIILQYLIILPFNFSYEVEKFARNTGLKLFRTSVKENLNIARVFQFLSERHIEAVSRWSTDDPSMNDHDFSFQIGQNTRDVRVRFAGFPDDNSNNSQSNNHHTHSGKLNSGSRLRNNHNSLSNNVNNGGIFLHKVVMKSVIH